MAELLVSIASHNFSVSRVSARGRPVVESFARRMIQRGFQRAANGQSIYAALRVYATATADRTIYRFHVNQLKEFKEHLKLHYLSDDLVDFVYIPIPDPVEVDLPLFEKWQPQERQKPVIEYLDDDSGDYVSKFLNLQTGFGKGFCSMKAMSNRGLRTLIIVKPMYLDKWVAEIRSMCDMDVKDLIVVRGSSQLMALLLMADDGLLESKIILISNKTIQNWIKLYETMGDGTLEMGYPCLPGNMCEQLGVGMRIIDEVHQDFHLNFKIDLYTNVARSISLSATLLSDDEFMNRMYEIAYPARQRYSGQAYHKYISAKAIIYKIRDVDRIRTKDAGSNNYSHHQFEKSILRNKILASNYLNLIKTTLELSYFKDRKPTQKAIVFCASIDMCTIVTEYLKKMYMSLDVRRYVEEDPYENLMTADICVSTLISAGTAVDIPNLTTVVLTTCVSSIQSNVQSFGRLRELKDGTVPEFCYFACEYIPKHIEYHTKKKDILKDRALHYKALFIGEPL
jgi:hypothetical protein